MMKFFGGEKKRGEKAGNAKGDEPESPKRLSYVGREMPKTEEPVLRIEAKRINDEGMEHYRLSDIDGAIERFNKAVETDPKYAEPYHHLFAAYYKKGDLAKAMAAADNFLRLADPSNPAAQQLRALMDSSQTAANPQAPASIPENHASLCTQAIGYAQQGDFDKALPLFARALKINPSYGPGWSDMGLCLVEMGNYSDAAYALAKARELMPNDVKNWAFLAMARIGLGDQPGAEACVAKCKELGASDQMLGQLRALLVMHRQ